jgi:hypothetical protein
MTWCAILTIPLSFQFLSPLLLLEPPLDLQQLALDQPQQLDLDQPQQLDLQQLALDQLEQLEFR